MRPRQVEGDLALTVLWQVSREGDILLRFEDGKPLTKLLVHHDFPGYAERVFDFRNGPSRLDAADGVVQPVTTAE